MSQWHFRMTLLSLDKNRTSAGRLAGLGIFFFFFLPL